VAEVCIDAGFGLKLVLNEPEQQRVRARWAVWNRTGVGIIAPLPWLFESHSTLRLRVYTGDLTDLQARNAWRLLLARRVQTLAPTGLFDQAWGLAIQLNRPRTYDMTYHALAELRGCECWTADKRLFNATQGRFSWLHFIDELP